MFDLAVASTTIKAIAGVARDAGNIQLYNEIIALQGTLLELIAQNAALIEANANIRIELADLRTKQREREQMQFESNVYWRVADAAPREGPFCPKCLDGNHKSVRLMERNDDHCWRCNVCDTAIVKPGPSPYALQQRREYDPFVD